MNTTADSDRTVLALVLALDSLDVEAWDKLMPDDNEGLRQLLYSAVSQLRVLASDQRLNGRHAEIHRLLDLNVRYEAAYPDRKQP